MIARFGRTLRRRFLPVQQDAARHVAGRSAHEGEQEVRPARADEARQAHDLSAPDGQRDVAHAECAPAVRIGDRQSFDAQDLRRPGGRRREIRARNLAADHEAHHLGLVEAGRVARGHTAPVAQHRDAVGEAPHFVELVGDVDDRDAALAQAPHEPLEPSGLFRPERGRGLVHDDQARVEREGARDRDELALPRLEALDPLARPHVRFADGLELRGRAAIELADVDEAERRPRLAPEEDVLGGRERRDELELLRDHGDPALDRFARRRQALDRAVQPDFALVGVGGDFAREDVDQRRLARAVLADERMDLAGDDVEVHAVERADAGKLIEMPRASRSGAPLTLPRVRPGGRGRAALHHPRPRRRRAMTSVPPRPKWSWS